MRAGVPPCLALKAPAAAARTLVRRVTPLPDRVQRDTRVRREEAAAARGCQSGRCERHSSPQSNPRFSFASCFVSLLPFPDLEFTFPLFDSFDCKTARLNSDADSWDAVLGNRMTGLDRLFEPALLQQFEAMSFSSEATVGPIELLS